MTHTTIIRTLSFSYFAFVAFNPYVQTTNQLQQRKQLRMGHQHSTCIFMLHKTKTHFH